ncbi:AMP-binding protein [Amycolatopsis acidiphila]|uniref:AMP-binding protein n=1 Tax=Amycolatopsis acidiphila TaxID=715473 RepID=A0A558AM31_9PSEU|nr:AMP-binding protein [Amycolatopsis acidiphila]TVT25300.1 AMP-binding protein [Amycolatopsis acidiphila]UIJ62423.1 AMP-binding protein [Amycolatopsis acidiphila]GHG83606.1 cyclohexanecarboxylate-CoA ligase [Amycolatopsis acidiphila]
MTFARLTDRYSAEEIEQFYATGRWCAESLFELLEQQVELRPDKVFLTDDTRSLTFRELRDGALRLAAGLRRAGVSRGDRVCVQIPNWVEFGQIVVALSRLGAIMVPIMPIYRLDEVGYIVRNAGARMAITCHTFKKFDYVAMYQQIRQDVPDLETVVVVRGEVEGATPFTELVADVDPEVAAAEIGPGAGPDDHFVIVYSSGTTSRPKGCLHTFNTMACGSRLLAKGFGYTDADVQFGPSPVTHTTGLVTSILLPLMHGAASHLMAAWEPKAGLEHIRRFGCTIAVTATTFLQMLTDVYDPAVHDASSLRLWVAAGAPIPAAFVEQTRKLLPGCRVLSLYGRTENVTTTMCTLDDDPARSLTSDGRVLPGSSVKIVDPAGKEVPRGQEGDIAYRGPMHMLEYIGNPAETAALFTPEGYSRSGDLGVMDADGYVRVTGRLKDIVIRGGMNISVRQVEDLLTGHPAVAAAAVVGMPDRRLGERICLYLVPKPGHGNVTLEQVKEFLLSRGLAIQKMPERLEVVSELPMTATGKIQKHRLRADITAKLEAAETRV